jgi:hypothetical protein
MLKPPNLEICEQYRAIELVLEEFLEVFGVFHEKSKKYSGLKFQQFLLDSSNTEMTIFYAPIRQINGYLFFKDNLTGLNFGIKILHNPRAVSIHFFDKDSNELLYFSNNDNGKPNRTLNSIIRVKGMFLDSMCEDSIQVSSSIAPNEDEVQRINEQRRVIQSGITELLREEETAFSLIKFGRKKRQESINMARRELDLLKNPKYSKIYSNITNAEFLELLASFENLLQSAILMLSKRKNP